MAREIREKLEGPLEVADVCCLYGMVVGDAHVRAGGTLELYGTVTGNVHIERGGRAIINGTVSGSVRNEGRVEVAGVIGGNLTGDGSRSVTPQAKVGGWSST